VFDEEIGERVAATKAALAELDLLASEGCPAVDRCDTSTSHAGGTDSSGPTALSRGAGAATAMEPTW
jgi:hypothetical protein